MLTEMDDNVEQKLISTRNPTCWSLTSKFVEEACHREHKLIMPKVELIIRKAHLSSPKTELMTPEVHLTVRIVSLTDRTSSSAH